MTFKELVQQGHVTIEGKGKDSRTGEDYYMVSEIDDVAIKTFPKLAEGSGMYRIIEIEEMEHKNLIRKPGIISSGW